MSSSDESDNNARAVDLRSTDTVGWRLELVSAFSTDIDPVLLETLAQYQICHCLGSGFATYNNIDCRQVVLHMSKRLANDSFDSVAVNRVADTLGGH
jgi:hypothetical protein